jgi:DNA-binding CsgD family transcriptional regulator/PAS domain-containing protein
MSSTQELSALLHTLYAAPTQPELWHVFLQDLCAALNLAGAAILHQNLERGEYNAEYAFGVAADGAPMYQRYYGTIDEWRPRFLEKAEGEFVVGDDLCGLEKLKTTEFYNDFLVKHDLRLYGAVATVKRPKQVELVTLYQSWKSKPPGSHTEDLIALMVPHIRRALQLRRSFVDLRARSASFESALNLLQTGIVFLDGNGNVVLMNARAEGLVRVGAFQLRANRLAVPVRGETARLEALIRAVIGKEKGKEMGPGGSMMISRSQSRPLTLIVASLGALSGRIAPRASIVLFIYDPEQRVQLPLDLLKDGYHLTVAEARLALILAEGHSLKDAAEMNGVTFNTARAQLRSVFGKTGVRRQAELIRLLLGSSASIRV